jgi:hypothetical protein
LCQGSLCYALIFDCVSKSTACGTLVVCL